MPKTEKERNAYKREWERTRGRKACSICGQPMGAGSRSRRPRECQRCERQRRAAKRKERGERIAEMWRDGASMKEIAPAVGFGSVAALGIEMVRLRREQIVDLPFRYSKVSS